MVIGLSSPKNLQAKLIRLSWVHPSCWNNFREGPHNPGLSRIPKIRQKFLYARAKGSVSQQRVHSPYYWGVPYAAFPTHSYTLFAFKDVSKT